MRYIKFQDKCVIKRPTGEIDEYGTEIADIVYEGSCLYSKGGQTSLSVVTRDDVMLLPTNDYIININDKVSGTEWNGQPFSAVVKISRNIQMPVSKQQYTRIELIKATDNKR